MRRALPIAAAMVVTVAAVLGWLLLRTSHASGPALTTVSGPGYRVAYPDTWKRQGALHGLPNDVILLVRDPSPRGPLDPGLIIRRTLRDPNLISEDVPALIMADQFRYPGAVVISRSRPPIPGAKDTVEVVTAFRSEERRVGKECRSRWSP